jgi:hypothetical protein
MDFELRRTEQLKSDSIPVERTMPLILPPSYEALDYLSSLTGQPFR